MNLALQLTLLFALTLFSPVSLNAQKDSSMTEIENVVLFDGTSLDQFRGYKDEKIGVGWKIEGNTLMFDGTGGGDIMTKKAFENFELMFDWKVESGSNSGVMYRVTTGDGAPYFSGPEYQILDDSKHRDGKNALTSAASLYALYAPVGKDLKPVGEWNSAKIVVNGDHVEHWLNGKRVVNVDIGNDDWNERKNRSKFKSWKKFAVSKRGHICFQDHGDKVWFQDMRVKILK